MMRNDGSAMILLKAVIWYSLLNISVNCSIILLLGYFHDYVVFFHGIAGVDQDGRDGAVEFGTDGIIGFHSLDVTQDVARFLHGRPVASEFLPCFSRGRTCLPTEPGCLRLRP